MVKIGASARDGSVNRENVVGKGGEDRSLEPESK